MANNVKNINSMATIFEKYGKLGIQLGLFVLIVVFFAIMNPVFLSTDNALSVARQSTYLAIMSLGQMCVLIVGGFDLSVGAIAALVSIVTSMVMLKISDPTVAIVAGILVGLGLGTTIGFINGFIVAIFGVSPFIATLGMMGIINGVTLMISSGAPVYGFTDKFSAIFGYGTFLGLPSPVIVSILVAIIMYILLNMTALGRHLWAIGGNLNAAVLSGLSNLKYKLIAYGISGFMAALTGIMLSARVSSGEPTLGHSMMMTSLVACVIGGVAVGGGAGNVPGALMGVILIGILGNGMNLMNMGAYGQEVVMGAFLLMAIIFDRYMHQGR